MDWSLGRHYLVGTPRSVELLRPIQEQQDVRWVPEMTDQREGRAADARIQVFGQRRPPVAMWGGDRKPPVILGADMELPARDGRVDGKQGPEEPDCAVVRSKAQGHRPDRAGRWGRELRVSLHCSTFIRHDGYSPTSSPAAKQSQVPLRNSWGHLVVRWTEDVNNGLLEILENGVDSMTTMRLRKAALGCGA